MLTSIMIVMFSARDVQGPGLDLQRGAISDVSLWGCPLPKLDPRKREIRINSGTDPNGGTHVLWSNASCVFIDA